MLIYHYKMPRGVESDHRIAGTTPPMPRYAGARTSNAACMPAFGAQENLQIYQRRTMRHEMWRNRRFILFSPS
jgi:hypothetical protein